MKGRQANRFRMDCLPPTAVDGGVPGPKRAWEWDSHWVTFSESVQVDLGEYAEMLVEDLLFTLPVGPREPGQSEVHYIDWGGYGLAITLTRDPDVGRLDTWVDMDFRSPPASRDLYEIFAQEGAPGEGEGM